MATSKRPAMHTRAFTLALHQQGGWVKDMDAYSNGQRSVCYTKRVDARLTLDLQLCSNGVHLLSRFINGKCTAPPMEFATVPGMLAAITHTVQAAMAADCAAIDAAAARVGRPARRRRTRWVGHR